MSLLRTLALIVLIRAILPMTEDVKERAEELRAVAVKAGCARPVVSMWLSEDGMEIEVTCL